MKTKLCIAAVIAFSALGSAAYAGEDDDATKTGLVGGAATGAVVGGPVGAVIGGVVGATAGAAIDDTNTGSVRKQKVIVEDQEPDVVIEPGDNDVVIENR
jgi:hypothetical protein